MVLAEGKESQDSASQRYRALLAATDAIAFHQQMPELFQELAKRLRPIVGFATVYFILHDPDKQVMRSTMVDSTGPSLHPLEVPMNGTATGHVFQTQQPVVISDSHEEERFPLVLDKMREQGIRSVCVLPMSTAQRRLGALVFCSAAPNEYDAADLEFLESVSKQVAIAVENGINRKEAEHYETQLAAERDRAQLLLEINNVLVSKFDLHELVTAISACLSRVVPHEYCSLVLHEEQTGMLRLHALHFPGGKSLVREGACWPLECSPAGVAFASGEPYVLNELSAQSFSNETGRWVIDEGIQSACWFPLIRHKAALGTFCLGWLRPSGFDLEHAQLLTQVAGQIAIAVENALAFQQITELKNKLNEEKLYLENEIRTEHNFDDIVGESPAWKQVMGQVRIVAPSAATVLILGETGTGKELIARSIHKSSDRSERTFVKLNCAAIPTGLLESELFGHEKGAFTGAISRKIGRFELADGGTLFLDEIGDIPLELQPKLLRALQDQEFERLGSNHTLRVNVRVLAATNRDLEEMLSRGAFRRDLFYRLNVFPIRVPPLRARTSDIPVLVRHFAQKYAKRIDRRIQEIPTKSLDALTRWSWPGNVRELENLIERAVILSRGPVLEIPLAELEIANAANFEAPGSLDDAKRRHILRALRDAGGVIGGPSGAAARLGVKRTTLNYKLKKLGIDPGAV